MERADLLLEPRARRGAVPRFDDLAFGRSFAPARAAAARRGVRDDRVLGVAQCRCPRRGPGRLCRKRPKPGVDQLALQPVGRRRRPPAWGAAGLWRRRRSDRHAADRRQPWPDLARRSDRPDQPDPSNHHRRGGVGARSQSVRTGRAGEPIAHSDGDARPGLAVDLRPQSLHHGLSARAKCAAFAGMARARRCFDRAAARFGGSQRTRVAHPAVAGGDLPVALAARDLRLFRADGDRRHRASRIGARLVLDADGRGPGGDDGRRDGRHSKCAGARLAEGQCRQASVRASLRLSQRVAALHRDARPIGPRRRGAVGADREGLCRCRGCARRAAARQRRPPRPGCRRFVELAVGQPADGRARRCARILERRRKQRADPGVRRAARRLGGGERESPAGSRHG